MSEMKFTIKPTIDSSGLKVGAKESVKLVQDAFERSPIELNLDTDKSIVEQLRGFIAQNLGKPFRINIDNNEIIQTQNRIATLTGQIQAIESLQSKLSKKDKVQLGLEAVKGKGLDADNIKKLQELWDVHSKSRTKYRQNIILTQDEIANNNRAFQEYQKQATRFKQIKQQLLISKNTIESMFQANNWRGDQKTFTDLLTMVREYESAIEEINGLAKGNKLEKGLFAHLFNDDVLTKINGLNTSNITNELQRFVSESADSLKKSLDAEFKKLDDSSFTKAIQQLMSSFVVDSEAIGSIEELEKELKELETTLERLNGTDEAIKKFEASAKSIKSFDKLEEKVKELAGLAGLENLNIDFSQLRESKNVAAAVETVTKALREQIDTAKQYNEINTLTTKMFMNEASAGTGSAKVPAEASVDGAEFVEQVQEAVNESGAKVKVKVEPDVENPSEFVADVERKLEGEKAGIDIEAKVSSPTEFVDEVSKQLEGKTVKVDVEARDSKAGDKSGAVGDGSPANPMKDIGEAAIEAGRQAESAMDKVEEELGDLRKEAAETTITLKGLSAEEWNNKPLEERITMLKEMKKAASMWNKESHSEDGGEWLDRVQSPIKVNDTIYSSLEACYALFNVIVKYANGTTGIFDEASKIDFDMYEVNKQFREQIDFRKKIVDVIFEEIKLEEDYTKELEKQAQIRLSEFVLVFPTP